MGSHVEGATTTSDDHHLDFVPSIIIPLLRINHLFVVPWIIFSLPPAALLQQSIPVAIIITIVGVAGMLTRNRAAASLASASLVLLIVWAKVAEDLFRLPATDTALLLFQFMLVILLMEASSTVISFQSTTDPFGRKDDEMSKAAMMRATRWVKVQLLSLGRLTLGTFALSLGLLVLGSTISVSSNQLAFSGILVLGAVIAILFLLTYRREPENSRVHRG